MQIIDWIFYRSMTFTSVRDKETEKTPAKFLEMYS